MNLEDIWIDWQKDWNLAARELLGVNLDHNQQEILSAVQHNMMVSVSSGTARGKDFVAAVAALCFFYLTPKFDHKGKIIENTKVAMTAPTGRQVENIMYPEITRLFYSAKTIFPILPGRLTGCDVRTDYDEWFLTGFKADENKPESWSGFHAVNTMFVVTEASGISEIIFDAIEGNLQGNSRILIVFNPNKSVGYAAKSQKSNRWQSFKLSSLTAPNVIENKIIIPGQVDYKWVNDKIANHARPIDQSEIKIEKNDFEFENKWYRPDNWFRIKVLGEFPESSEDTLIPGAWIEAANKRWEEQKKPDKPLNLGVDVAGMGIDDTVFTYRFGDFVEKIYIHNSGGIADHMETAGKIAIELKEKKSYAFIDTIGEGAGVYSRLIELNFKNAISCKFSESAKGLTDKTNVYEFENMRAYLFWAIRDWLNPQFESTACLPPNDFCFEELTEIKWQFTSLGKIKIEPKEDIIKRLKRSPGCADSLANTFYPYKNINFGLSAVELLGYI